MKPFYVMMMTAVVFAACQSSTDSTSPETKDSNTVQYHQAWSTRFVGDFVSDGYVSRKKGTDWYAVIINQVQDSLYQISIRSRADKKKP
ncbi:MAG TPA: hypothetical protein DCO78_07145, partial [Chitinophagaceae bacterium]|nr:hypothetical protein [Chitinophagaceae bacterium]